MIVDPAVLPGLLLLAAELAALAAVGYVIVRVALRQEDDCMALAQGLVVGLALWGLITNFVMYAVPGLAGAAVGWGVTLALGAGLAWRAPNPIRPRPRVLAGFAVACAGALLGWAGQSPALVDSRCHEPRGVGRLDPRRRVSTGVLLDSVTTRPRTTTAPAY